MDVYFRLDCNQLIGSGHFFRSLSLAKIFTKKNYKVCFITCKLASNYKKILNDYNIQHIEIKKKQLSKIEEFDLLKKIILSLKNIPKYFIIDHYNIVFSVQKKLKLILPKLILITDLTRRKYYCDFLINPNFGASKNLYEKSFVKSNLILGPKYYPIRFKFSKNQQKKNVKFKKNNYSFLISLGSNVDEYVLLKILLCLFSIDLPLKIQIIEGSNSFKILKNFIKKNNTNKKIEIIKKRSDLDNIYKQNIFYIGASGVTLYESIFFGLIPFPIITANNQRNAVEMMLKKEVISSMYNRDFKIKKLKKYIMFYLNLGPKKLNKKVYSFQKLLI